MRKILLLTVIGGLGFSSQIFSALNLFTHSIVIEYLESNNRGICMLSCTGELQDGAFVINDIVPISIYTKIILKDIGKPGIPATKVFSHQDLLSTADLYSENYPLFITRNVTTVSTLHFNRMVNRKRILLSG